MRISEIIFKIQPYYQPHGIELSCSMSVDGKELHWKEIFDDTDFESRIEGYFDHMKRRIICAVQKEKK